MKLGILLLSALTLTGFARPRDPEPDRDSLPPPMQAYYRLKSGRERPSAEQDRPDSLNVRTVGKWNRARLPWRNSKEQDLTPLLRKQHPLRLLTSLLYTL